MTYPTLNRLTIILLNYLILYSADIERYASDIALDDVINLDYNAVHKLSSPNKRPL